MPTSLPANFTASQAKAQLPPAAEELQRLQSIFKQQQTAFAANPYPELSQRLASLKKLKNLLLNNQAALCVAVNSDFGCRSADETLIAEILTSVQSINFTLKHLARWLRPEKRRVSLLFMPASNKVFYQPLGVVGIMVPWNYPIQLALVPLMTALASGNTALLKMSEFTPNTNALLQQLLAEEFAESQVALVQGEVEVSSGFAAKPWNHLIFTGSTSVGRKVMAAAAKNLTPVTLELGGKSPALVTAHANLKNAVASICFGKALNAGQTCIAPDYVLLPEDQEAEFIQLFKKTFRQLYPNLKNNPDYSAIINPQQLARLKALLADAEQQGAKITAINPAKEDFTGSNKLPPYLIQQGTAAMQLMQEEIFGPLLPLVTYRNLTEAVAYINQHSRPLALYAFTHCKKEQSYLLKNTHAGGVTFNDTLMHLAQEDLPFGGIGASGMGQYHGKEGFISLSKAKAVHTKGRLNLGKLIFPPYGTGVQKLIKKFFIR